MTRYVLKTDPKFLRRQFEKAVGKSIPKVLTELITNSDDSYKRMTTAKDVRTASGDFGRIDVILDFRKKVTKVVDQAQGLSKIEMENKFPVYGKEPDDRRSGIQTRSLFGKGLRDVLFTQKLGVVKSIKNGVSSIAKFYWGRVKNGGIEEPIVDIRSGPNVDKDLRMNWSLSENGTVVEFRLREDVRLPQHEKLFEKINNFYMLRMINSNLHRKLILTSFDKSAGKNTDTLHYNFPSGELVVKKSLVLEHEGSRFPVELELSRCEESLVQGGLGYEEREGGLLVLDEEDNVLDLTLFSFDTDPSASRLFGIVRIIGSGVFITEKLNANPPEVILSEEREGLVRGHPFYRALAKLVDPILEPFVREERVQESSKGQFSSETQAKHKDAMEILNKMYRELVGRPETGDGMHGKQPFVPDYISFIRSSITITRQTDTPIALLINCKTVPNGAEISVDSDNPKITVSPEKFTVDHSGAKDGLLIKVMHIVGYETGLLGKISAKTSEHCASVEILVIDKEIFYPKNGIEFYPSNVKVRDGKKRSLHLYIDAEKIRIGSHVMLSCNSSNFHISKENVEFVDEMKITPDVGHVAIGIVGHGIGQECVVEAKADTFASTATVLVASKKEEKLRERGERFKPPEFMHIPNLKVQTWIRPTDGTILINLSDPVNEKYFGDEPYKNADAKLHCQIRLAELVLDECLNEIVTNAWGRTLPRRFPDNPEVDIRLYVAEKKFEIGQIVHNHFVTIGYDEQHIGSGASRHKEKEITESTLRNAELPQSLEGLNLSWVIAEKLAGCASPSDDYDLLFLKKQSISLIVRLAEDREAEVTSEQIKKIGLKDIHEPIPDKTAPSPSQIKKIVDGVKDALDKGEKVAVSCKAGKGRTGTILTCILVSLGYKLHEAIDQVQATRGQNKAWETDEQYHAILGFTETIRSGSKMQDGV